MNTKERLHPQRNLSVKVFTLWMAFSVFQLNSFFAFGQDKLKLLNKELETALKQNNPAEAGRMALSLAIEMRRTHQERVAQNIKKGKRDKFDTGIEYGEISKTLNKAIEQLSAAKAEGLLADAHYQSGLHFSDGNSSQLLGKSSEEFGKAAQLYKKLNDIVSLAEAYQESGKNKIKHGYRTKNEDLIKQGLNSLEEAAALFEKEKMTENLVEIYRYISSFYESAPPILRNTEKAREYDNLAMDAFSQQKLEQETAAQLEEIRFQRMIIYAVSGGSVLLVFFLLSSFFGLRKIKSQKKEIELEKEKSEKLLLNILPATTAEEIKENGKAKPNYFTATILFTDFKGFTQVSEEITPSKLIRMLDVCFQAFDEICARNNLERIKTIGDAYMAAGGLPEKNRTHPQDAVKAALEMQAFMVDWIQKQKDKEEPFFELRAGIHTGRVVAGVIGTQKIAYDIWGDAVNVAARMEQSGKPGKVNISEETYQKVKTKFECVSRGKIKAKNKGEIEMYFVEKEL